MAKVLDKRGARVFVNDLDTYESKHIARFLTKVAVGSTSEDGQEEEEEEANEGERRDKNTYQVVGTASANYEKPDYIEEVLTYDSKQELLEHVMECDFVIFNINAKASQLDEANWLVEELTAKTEQMENSKIFVLLSTVMTWAKTPTDPEDPELAFQDGDYRRRKPHPNFKDHATVERTVIKCGKKSKSKLSTYVVAAGITYGNGEGPLHFFFKHAWHNAPSLPIFGEGTNVLPTIHVSDLACVMQNIMEQKPKTKYMAAVDHANPANTLEEIVKAVSSQLCTGKIVKVATEDAFQYSDISQSDFDQITVDLRMDADTVKEFSINWKAENGIVENIAMVVREYKEQRSLLPLKIMVHGPPAVGKSVVAKQLAEHFKIHHLTIKEVIDHAIEAKERSVARADVEGEEEEEDEGNAAEDAETLEAVKEQLAGPNKRIDDSYILKFFNERLMSKPCQNQGFVLDGFPKTKEQARELFGQSEEAEEDEGSALKYNKMVTPDVLVHLEATDEFLKERVMNLPERVVQGTHNTEEHLIRRLGDFRTNNTDEETLLNFFDENEIHANVFNVNDDQSELHKAIVNKIIARIGAPHNYGLTKDEKEMLARREEEERMAREEREQLERQANERREAELKAKRQRDWTTKLEEVKREEAELLEAQSLPLRNYLMAHVMPTLTRGMIECVKLRPDDPVDHLAEYLFKNNPQVD